LDFARRARKRPAVSEIVGSVLAIAITLVAGAATWTFVRSQAASSEAALQSSALTNDNFLGEQFKVTDMTFGSTTQTTVWIYNLGTLTLSVFSIRLYDSSGLVNILYNYTQSGSVFTNRVFDLRASSSYYHSACRLSGSSYESPVISSTKVKSTNIQTFALTIPNALSNCPSYGNAFTNGTTYSVVVTGLYGNVITYFQVK
jgi:flagellin-like protein